MQRFNFRQKVLLLAVALVMAIQLLTLFPVLQVIKRDAEDKARRSVDLAGIVFEEFIRNRAAQLRTTAGVLVSDFGFKQAVAGGDQATIRSALGNHAARVGAEAALLLDLDGTVLASSRDRAWPLAGVEFGAYAQPADDALASHGVTLLDRVPYETVTVPLRAPTTIARVMLGFPIDAELAQYIQRLTGLQTSFLRFADGEVHVVASTLPAPLQVNATALASPGTLPAIGPDAENAYLTELRPFLPESRDVYVALQLPLSEATASFRRIRGILFAITGASLLFAVSGAFWLARRVTQPVHTMARAARRMQEGIYTEPVTVASKDELGDLAAGFNAMQDAIADREQAIYRIAHYDGLTGLPNRKLLADQLREALQRVDRLTVVSLVPNRFERMISTLGRRAGDEVIALVASLLGNQLHDGQLLGHASDQEFVLVLPGYDIDQTVEHVVRLADLLRAGLRVSGANISLQATAGIASYPAHSRDAAELLRLASLARNEAQLQAEPVAVYSTEQEDRALEQIRIVGDFPRALRNRELELCFQPKIDCRTRAVCGAEALVRWRHPQHGLLMPEAFIDAIEQSGGIPHLTRWALEHSIAHCAGWRATGLDVSIAVNISVDDLTDEYLPHFLLDMTKRNGLRPGHVTLEVTESAIMHKIHMSLSVASCLRELGFRVAIDDFGMGQSSLAQLKRLPLDELKIDKTFVTNLETERDEAIVRAAIELAHQFGLSVVAEGVEDARALERLRALSCEYAQGYFIGRPMPAADFPQWARNWTLVHGGVRARASAAL
jgi:diguanylate cyclase (GGDEF)-like protein